MGQAAGAWCGDGLSVNSADIPIFGLRSATQSKSRSDDVAEAQQLLEGCPRELADALRDTGQWEALRCRPWLSSSAFRGLQRSLQRCHLLQLEERYREASNPEDCSYSVPVNVSWTDLDIDHVISAGQVFRRDQATGEKVWQMRRVGLEVVRQGKIGVVLMAGGANLRLGIGEPPVGCMKKLLKLCSGKSILQLCAERIRRVISLCRTMEDNKTSSSKLSVPVFIMTSRLTHASVQQHMEENRYFGLSQRDVFFFEQPVAPVLGDDGSLLPQSLGGEFAHVPGGTGQVLRALAGSSALEQMRDRGVECLHIVGTENILCRVCDPVFIGFCRDLDVDCAAKIVRRLDPSEDIELFCVRSSPVTTHFADIEEAACGVEPGEAPGDALRSKRADGSLHYCGSINSVFMSVQYIEDVVGRPVRQHRVSRVVPYLDFHVEGHTDNVHFDQIPVDGQDSTTVSSKHQSGGTAVKVLPGSWPAETTSSELACQRALLVAAAEVREACRPKAHDREEAWRCDVHLDVTGPLAVVRVRAARRGPCLLSESLQAPGVAGNVILNQKIQPIPPLMCSLVVPSKPNAVVLESSILDYFVYTDRAVAFEVDRANEYAPVREGKGQHSVEVARATYYKLHHSWAAMVGACIEPSGDGSEVVIEVSPLLSYEGEGLSMGGKLTGVLKSPCHLPGIAEIAGDDSMDGTDELADSLDNRLFYLQEYPRRLEMRHSHAPQFRMKASDPHADPARTARKSPGQTSTNAVDGKEALGNSSPSTTATAASNPGESNARSANNVTAPTAKGVVMGTATGGHVGIAPPLSQPNALKERVCLVQPGNPGTAGVSDSKPKGVKAMPTTAPPYEAGAVELPTGSGPCIGGMPVAASNAGFWERPGTPQL